MKAPNMGTDPTHDELIAAKTDIITALSAAGFVRAEVVYDGYDDNGNINTVTAFDGAKRPTVVLNDCAAVAPWQALSDQMEVFAWKILDTYHGGFENNDGGHGTLTIDGCTATVRLEHADHYVAYDETVTEV